MPREEEDDVGLRMSGGKCIKNLNDIKCSAYVVVFSHYSFLYKTKCRSALTGTLCASAAAQAVMLGTPFLGLSSNVWILGYVASLATKLADTFASEIGKAYGKTTFLITTLKPVPRGVEGAISLEGTLASVVGGLLLSLYAYMVVGLIPTIQGVGVATFAAFFATMVESLLGATLQEKDGMKWMTNEVVNFFNTLIGGVTAMMLGVLLLGM